MFDAFLSLYMLPNTRFRDNTHEYLLSEDNPDYRLKCKLKQDVNITNSSMLHSIDKPSL